MNIYLIRHAESEQNTGVAKEIADNFIKITENGKMQAKNCAEFLDNYVQENNINLEKTAMFVSPFLRARETAQIINEKLNIKNYNYDYALIEREFGLFDILSIKERNKYLKKNKEFKKYYTNTGFFYTEYPCGESIYDVVLRMKMFINTTLKNLDKQIENVVIVMHAYTINAFLMAYFNYLPEWLEDKYEPENCSIRLIENDIDKGFIYGNETNILVST